MNLKFRNKQQTIKINIQLISATYNSCYFHNNESAKATTRILLGNNSDIQCYIVPFDAI